jgi:DNA-binding transcriptional LysR family regulator
VVSSLLLLSCAKWNLVRSFQILLVANRSEPIDVSAKPLPKYHSIGSGGTVPMLDVRMAVVGAPFRGRPEPKKPHEPINHNCISLRLPTHGGLYAWEFERGRRELRVRVEGQLTYNTTAQMLNAALTGLRLADVPEGSAQPHLAKNRLKRALGGLVPSLFRLSPLLPEPAPILRGVCVARRCAPLPALST